MQLTISILSVDKISKTAKNGKTYFQLEVAYKNNSSGKVESKKLMPFGETSQTHKVLSEAKTGDVFDITSVKNNETGYWDWTGATQQAPGAIVPTSPQVLVQHARLGQIQGQGSAYPTGSEREATQRSIVRQSSLKAAVDSFAQLKNPAETETILKRAQEFVDFVNEKMPTKQLDLFNTPSDLGDDTPD